MEPRVTTTIVGLITLILGIVALFYPEIVLTRVLGYSLAENANPVFVRGEIRAVYGGMMTVAGIATVLAAMDPVRHAGRIMFVALLWLGACGGRLLGVFVDGSPGLFGWLSVVFEAVMGGTLVLASQSSPAPTVRVTTPVTMSAPPPPPPAAPTYPPADVPPSTLPPV
jgi:hypothetical protein